MSLLEKLYRTAVIQAVSDGLAQIAQIDEIFDVLRETGFELGEFGGGVDVVCQGVREIGNEAVLELRDFGQLGDARPGVVKELAHHVFGLQGDHGALEVAALMGLTGVFGEGGKAFAQQPQRLREHGLRLVDLFIDRVQLTAGELAEVGGKLGQAGVGHGGLAQCAQAQNAAAVAVDVDVEMSACASGGFCGQGGRREEGNLQRDAAATGNGEQA